MSPEDVVENNAGSGPSTTENGFINNVLPQSNTAFMIENNNHAQFNNNNNYNHKNCNNSNMLNDSNSIHNNNNINNNLIDSDNDHSNISHIATNGWNKAKVNGVAAKDLEMIKSGSPINDLREAYFANNHSDALNNNTNNVINNNYKNGQVGSPTKGWPTHTKIPNGKSTSPLLNGNRYTSMGTEEETNAMLNNDNRTVDEEKFIVQTKNPNGGLNNNHRLTNGNKHNGTVSTGNGHKDLERERESEESEPLTGTTYECMTKEDRNNGTDRESSKAEGHENDYNEDDDEDDEEEDLGKDDRSCGVGSCKPKWAHKLATTKVFMVVFLLAWVLQGMYSTYFVSVITTIEKLFQIQSKVTGMLMSVTEVGQISTALFLTYFAGRGHRPRWIACGMVLFAISAFGCTLPHFFFGDRLLQANSILHSGNNVPTAEAHHVSNGHGLTISAMALASDSNVTMTMPKLSMSEQSVNLCLANEMNSTMYRKDKDCEQNILDEQAKNDQITTIVLAIFAISFAGLGVGQTAVSTLGIPYIDDNVASRDSPIYIAITIGVRILGPAAGFILGSVCTRIYVNVSVDPGIGPSDPKWVGAWWLGLLLVSTSMMLTSMAMFLFPKHLRGNRIPPPAKMRAIEEKKKLEKQQLEEQRPQLKDFPKTIRRQLRNDILMCRTASSVFHLLPVAGLYTFLPKYLETQFRLTAHDAALITGINGILVMGIGIVISGIVILKFNPTARSVAAWIAFTAFVYACGMAMLMFIGCPMDDMVGLQLSGKHTMPTMVGHSINDQQLFHSKNQFFEPVCNLTSCDCDFDKFSPICGSDRLTYFSSCHAGCSRSVTEDGVMKFSDCKCIGLTNGTSTNQPSAHPPIPDLTAVSGFCDGNCKRFLPFIILFTIFVFMHSTGEVGSMLLIMRCTDPKDKAMAMGIIQFAIGLFGNVPCPIIYGAVVDSACLVWESFCDKQGACSLYNGDLFRSFFFGTTAGIMGLAFIMDLVVWRKAHRIDIDPGSSNNSETDCEKVVVPESSV